MEYVSWYLLTDHEGKPILDVNGNYHLMPTIESLESIWDNNSLNEHRISEIKQEIKTKLP